MASEMVERVARAIWDANGWHPPDAEDRKTLPWSLCLKQARAAIEAMREPTIEMVLAGDEARRNWRSPNEGRAPGDIVSHAEADFVAAYRAMITSALA